MNIAPILKARFIVVALAGLLVSALLADQASANEEEYVTGAACGHGHRISHGSADWDANCLSARWSNSWNWSRRGYEVNVKNECSEYGTIVANIDAKGGNDIKWTLNSSSEERSLPARKIRDVTCCINHSDLCFKRQIEGEWIKHVTVTGGGWSQNWVDVRTHERRYNFCQDNPDDIYCEVDPRGGCARSTAPLQLRRSPLHRQRLRESICAEFGCRDVFGASSGLEYDHQLRKWRKSDLYRY